MAIYSQQVNERTISLTEARALSIEGDLQACGGTLLALAGGTLGYIALGFESTYAEVATAIPSFAVAAGGLAMIGLGIRKIFQADRAMF